LSMPPLFSNKHSEIDSHRRLASSSLEENMSAGPLVLHVAVCSIMMNMGKLVPAFCYRSEASWRERLALAVAMMPRGEVGAAIIVNALAMGIRGAALTIALFCLACNMAMMSGFILLVRRLTKDTVPCLQASSEAALRHHAEPGSPRNRQGRRELLVAPTALGARLGPQVLRTASSVPHTVCEQGGVLWHCVRAWSML
jgi:Kef-type K+ transport system membrane component KefB